MYLKHLWHENYAFIPCVSLRTLFCWLSLVENSAICTLFLDFTRFAINRLFDYVLGQIGKKNTNIAKTGWGQYNYYVTHLHVHVQNNEYFMFQLMN